MSGRTQDLITKIYSYTADKLYEPVVVKRAFPLFGGDLHDVVEEQGRRAVASAQGRPILDVPIGTAFYTLSMAADHSGLIVGSDIAEGMVRQAKKVANEAALDIHALPFATGSFGAVMCTNGLQVIPGLTGSVAEIARVLAPGGILYCTVITLPVSRMLGSAGHRLPTMLRSGLDVAEAFMDAGLHVTAIDRQRLATSIEAVKPDAVHTIT
jgi:ubiquinone/menaquinone biosynthesis C-methylase UbiE